MYKKICKLITVKHPTPSPKMVIKTKNKIIIHNEYKILDFFCCCFDYKYMDTQTRLRWDTDTDLGGMSTNQNT